MSQFATPRPASASDLESLKAMADKLRIHSLETTARSRSGHPTTCLSSADLVSVLFFRYFRYDLKNPRDRRNDRFVLSKGHAAPLLWAALAESGAFPVAHLKTLREITSDLEGHPTPRNQWVDVATGSLGQGLSVGVGMALSSRMDGLSNRIYVLMGDGETAEGAIWEAAALAAHKKLDQLIGIVDVNALGQSQRTMYGHDLQTYQKRFESFGWATRTLDGHNLQEVDQAYQWALAQEGRPAALIARTNKGQGVSFLADQDGWHGKPVTDAETLEKALQELRGSASRNGSLRIASPTSEGMAAGREATGDPQRPSYQEGDTIATRAAYGVGLAKLGAVHPEVVALDGDTKNSTYSEKFMQRFPNRFVECYIAEQNMVGAAAGLSALGKIPFASTFAAFLTRAHDQIRMAAVSRSNLNLCGSHCGVSIGEDGPSQMGLEDLAMMRAISGSTVLYPSDGVSAEIMVQLAAETPGIVYIRTTRPKTPILYPNDEEFKVGGAKILRSSGSDKAAVVGAGLTVHLALEAYQQLFEEGIHIRVIDLYSVKPVDLQTLRQAARETGYVITVEDHYPQGGLGDAVLDALANESCRFKKLAVNGLPRSGNSAKLLDQYGISARCIIEAVKS